MGKKRWKGSLCNSFLSVISGRVGHTVFPRIIARGDYFFFGAKRGRLFAGRRIFEGGDRFKYCSLEVVPYIFCFIFPLNQKIITSIKLNMLGLFKCSLVNFHSLNRHWSVLLDHIALQLYRGDKGRIDGERGDYFKYFRQWRAINWGTAIIRGNTVKASQFRASRFSTHLTEDLTECRETLNAPVFFTVFTLSTSLDFYGKQHRPLSANNKGVRAKTTKTSWLVVE